jgi:hypothetical protein
MRLDGGLVLRTASCPAHLAGPMAVRSTPAGAAGCYANP